MANWTLSDLMIVASAREIQDGDVIFAGVGRPVLSALLAKLTFAPNAVHVFSPETGLNLEYV